MAKWYSKAEKPVWRRRAAHGGLTRARGGQPGRRWAKYAEWFDGRIWKLTLEDAARGCRDLQTFRINLSTTARRHGLRLRTRVDEAAGCVFIQAIDDRAPTSEP